nr:MAG TPA: hypothetical protein [Caudoviricetes sp.]
MQGYPLVIDPEVFHPARYIWTGKKAPARAAKEVACMIWILISACAVILGACVPVLSYSRYID